MSSEEPMIIVNQDQVALLKDHLKEELETRKEKSNQLYYSWRREYETFHSYMGPVIHSVESLINTKNAISPLHLSDKQTRAIENFIWEVETTLNRPYSLSFNNRRMANKWIEKFTEFTTQYLRNLHGS